MFPYLSAAGDTRAYKQFYRQQLDELMQERSRQKQQEAAQTIEEKRNYNTRVYQLQEAERQKDQTYKNYYRMLIQNQQQHGSQYISPFHSRDVMKDEHVKHALEYQKVRDYQQDLERRRRYEAMLLDYKQGLKHQIDTKRQVEEQQRSRHQREVEFYEKTSLSPRRLEYMEAIKRRYTEMKYKDDLDKIITEKEQSHLKTLRYDNRAFYPQPSQTNHNPLYNPLPFNIQNPYILRDMRRSMSPLGGSRTAYPNPPANQGFSLPRNGPPTTLPQSYFAGIGSSQLG